MFELVHDELGDETRQRTGTAGQVVVVDRSGRRQAGEPVVAAAGVEEAAQTDDVGAGGMRDQM